MGQHQLFAIRKRDKRRLVVLCCLGSTMALQPTRRRTSPFRSSSSSPLTIQRMVLTTPEAIIEQASTTNLLDDLIDESVRTSARRPIMMQFDPSSGWIWKRWKGTVLSETWDSCVYKMLYASVVYLACQSFPQIKESLSGFSMLWGQLLSVTTFTLTFFVNQSYALWRKCTELSRRLQGRLHDLDMALAAHAARKPPATPNEPSTYTAASRKLLELVSRYVRLFNMLTYASFTRSHRPMLTPRGMRRLVERGLMTPMERDVLVRAEIPATQRHNAVLLWIVRTFIEGTEAGHFVGEAGFEQQFLEKAHVCRSSYGAIGDELQGRMPLAYAHIVQVLVDLVLWMYPFMAYSAGMSGLLCVVGTGLLTMSYQGLFDLAKQFLDPYDNENYGKGEDPLVVDTLIAETNAGSLRWMNGLAEMPVSSQRIKDGELSDYLLPVRGYSVEELIQREEAKLEQQRQREMEELERQRAEEYEAFVREAAVAMIPAQMDTGCIKSNVTWNTTLCMVNATAGTPGMIPGLVGTSSISSAESVNEVLIYQSSTLKSLVPEGTAPASDYVEEIAVEDGEDEHKPEIDQKEPKRTLFGGATFDDDIDDDSFQVIEDWGAESNYVHTFEAFDPYLDLPSYDEVGPDGKEVRLSQMLADEVWEEEVEAAKEKESVKTYEDYIKRLSELKTAEESELLETQEILMASPGARETSDWSSKGAQEIEYYDQTKLDGISQLFGLPPNELSEIPSYEEPPAPAANFDNLSMLWDSSGSSPSEPKVSEMTASATPDSFDGISQLWGGDIDGETEELLSTSATPRVVPVVEEGDSSILQAATGPLSLSQMLADEVWMDEETEAPVMEQPFTFEDYEKQVQQIIDAENKERLETEAIMNAGPGADSLEVPEKDRNVELKAPNTTAAEDDLAVLEMDAIDESTERAVSSDENVTSVADDRYDAADGVKDHFPIEEKGDVADERGEAAELEEDDGVETDPGS